MNIDTALAIVCIVCIVCIMNSVAIIFNALTLAYVLRKIRKIQS